MTTVESAQSAYERIGGAPAVRAVVDRLYTHILEDPELAPYFIEVDVPHLATVPHVKRHMAALLSQVLGGPREYEGRELDEAHRGLHITQAHFDRVINYAMSVLYFYQVPADIIAAAGEALRGTAQHVVQP